MTQTQLVSTRMAAMHAEGDRIMMWTLAALLLLSCSMASWYGSWFEVGLIGVPAFLLPLVLSRLCPDGDARVRLAVSVSLMLFAALMIHQSRGMLEFHFSVFCFLAFLLFYRDWRCIVLAALVIALHHISFYFLQLNRIPLFVFPAVGSFWIVLLHAAFVVVETVLLSLFAVRMQHEAEEGAAVAGAAQRIGEGVLSEALDTQSHRFPLLQKMNEMRLALIHLLTAISGQSKIIDQACSTLSVQASHLHQHATSQRQSIQQIDQKMGLVNVAIKELGLEAEQACTLADNTMTLAGESREVIATTLQEIRVVAREVQGASERLEQLNRATEQVASIVEVIRKIADQTNLLALNAAIEAARAGEHGRGFAVVADEVKKLAAHTSEATLEINQVIHTIHDSKELAADGMQQMVACICRGEALSRQADQVIRRMAEAAEAASHIVVNLTQQLVVQSRRLDGIHQSTDEIVGGSVESDQQLSAFSKLSLQIECNVHEINLQISHFKID